MTSSTVRMTALQPREWCVEHSQRRFLPSLCCRQKRYRPMYIMGFPRLDVPNRGSVGSKSNLDSSCVWSFLTSIMVSSTVYMTARHPRQKDPLDYLIDKKMRRETLARNIQREKEDKSFVIVFVVSEHDFVIDGIELGAAASLEMGLAHPSQFT
ncbi:hypothetical protein EVAR_17900_1 [Eumeta japonica]|uniref:Uncharacterized protein n=1 Tax=Eumeta variegata TaxID=151549 RepID=A0A4C1UY41_EUMVA|nr:hypothetical protein EVAR_17900_1 [Eumeta japonica]